jgi:hypothetical protein
MTRERSPARAALGQIPGIRDEAPYLLDMTTTNKSLTSFTVEFTLPGQRHLIERVEQAVLTRREQHLAAGAHEKLFLTPEVSVEPWPGEPEFAFLLLTWRGMPATDRDQAVEEVKAMTERLLPHIFDGLPRYKTEVFEDGLEDRFSPVFAVGF